MSVIATVENAIVAQAKTALGFPASPVVRQVETLPGGWTLDMLKRALQMAPGVHVAFLGGQAQSDGGYINARFAAYAVSKGAREDERRRGNAREIGAYEIIELLGTHLDRLAVPEIGSLFARGVENVFSEAMFELGGTVYALTLELPNLPWPAKDTSSLVPFITFEGTHSMAPGTDEPLHQTRFTQ
jgi:phage gp37-like protein